MKILIDVSQIIYETGVSVYTKELVSHLVKLFPENEYILYGGSLRRGKEIRVLSESLGDVRTVTTFISPTIADVLWNRLHILPIEKIAGKADIFHSSDWAEPPSGMPKVTTIHDLSFIHYPKFTDPKISSTHKRRLYWVKRESTAVIVPSKATKEDATKLGISEKKIRVIPEAPSRIYKKQKASKIRKVRGKYKIEGRYALAVGTSPRKNIVRIINAFDKAKVESKLNKLVVVGGGVSRSNTKNLMYLGHVPTSELPALYSGASIFIYTSLYEGFGLPILEAFSCGCPVLTSNVSSMPEVAGSAAVLVDPESTEEITEGIVETLNKSEGLIEKGKERLRYYSWENAANATMSVYEELIKL